MSEACSSARCARWPKPCRVCTLHNLYSTRVHGLCHVCGTKLYASTEYKKRGEHLFCGHICLNAFVSTTVHTIPVELIVELRGQLSPARKALRQALREHVDDLLTRPVVCKPRPSTDSRDPNDLSSTELQPRPRKPQYHGDASNRNAGRYRGGERYRGSGRYRGGSSYRGRFRGLRGGYRGRFNSNRANYDSRRGLMRHDGFRRGGFSPIHGQDHRGEFDSARGSIGAGGSTAWTPSA
jgi:hypothetical protein